MSTTTFVEATSADPFARDLYRRAMRLLNDSTLDRKQRELHIKRLQGLLIEHQVKQDAKAQRLAAKAAKREQVPRAERNQTVADPSQVLARRKELGTPAVELLDACAQSMPAVASNDSQVTGRKRPVLSLKRA